MALARAEIQRLRAETARLTEAVQRLTPRAAGAELSEIQEKILLMLARGGRVQIQQIAAAVQSGVEATRFYVEELAARDLVHAALSVGAPATYSLAQEGRRYLIGRGLIR